MIASTEVLPEVTQRPLTRERRGGSIIRSALIAVETVIGGVDEHLDIRVRRGKSLDAIDRDHRVPLAEVRHHRAFWLLVARLEHAAAIVGNGAGEAAFAAGTHPGD